MKLLTYLELECSVSMFLFKYSNPIPVGKPYITIALSTQFLIGTGATCSIIKIDTFTQINKNQSLVALSLEKPPLAANGQTMPLKGRVVIQHAFDVEYISAFERMVYVSDSSDARMNILEKNFLADFGEFVNLRNSTLIWTVFACKGFKLSPCLKKLFP